MEAEQILDHLAKIGVQLEVEGDVLVARTNPDRISPDDLKQIRAEKSRLLEILQQQSNRSSETGPHSEDGIPLSFEQRRLWFLSEYAQHEHIAYQLANAIDIQGSLDNDVLEEALNDLIDRHESLRATFGSNKGVPYQRIQGVLRLQIPEIDLVHVAAEMYDDVLVQKVNEERVIPMDLEQGPLLRCMLFKQAHDRWTFVVLVHHLIFDGLSWRVFERELLTFYTTRLNGHKPHLDTLSARLADTLVWQQQWSDEHLEDELTWWENELEGSPDHLALPFDFEQNSNPSTAAYSVSFECSSSLVTDIRTAARYHRSTVFTVLLTVIDILLYRFTGQEDILVGAPIANRRRRELEPLIGFFTNTIILRTQVEKDDTFSSLIERVRNTVFSAAEHGEAPFDEVSSIIKSQSSGVRSPLVQVLFNYVTIDDEKYSVSGLDIRRRHIPRNTASFDLVLHVFEAKERLRVTFELKSDLFERETAQRLINSFQILLNAVLESPDTPVDQLQIMSESELAKIVQDWNDTTSVLSRVRCVHELFREQVDRTPTVTALVDGDVRLSYEELNRRANRLAHRLLRHGTMPGYFVGILMDQSADMIVSVLAIAKAGAAFVPLSPGFPRDRIKFILEDANVTSLISHLQHTSLIPEGNFTTVLLDKTDTKEEDDSDPNVSVKPNDAIYAIYTSGTTGWPKGVVVEHRNLFYYVSGLRERHPFDDCQNFLFAQALTFDSSQTTIFPALCFGATIHILSRAQSLDGQGVAAYVQNHRIDVFKTTSSHLKGLQSVCERPADLIPRKLLILGGEASNPSWIASMKSQTSCRIINHYGPTETTVGVCTHDVEAMDFSVPLARIPIGRPLPNVHTYILNESLHPQPPGVPGDLYIGGATVSRGYISRDAETRERFIANPFSDDKDARLYHTGDRCKYFADGSIDILGRDDDQVKIRGFRIETGEIESILLRHPSIIQTAVVKRKDGNGDDTLFAYVVSGSEYLDSSAVREYLLEIIPDYIAPSAIIFLEKLPLLISGKIDRRALPTPEKIIGSTTSSHEWTTSEAIIRDIWVELLGLNTVGIDDDFFAVGGHSLLAMQAVYRMNNAFETDVSIRLLFQQPTIRTLAQIIDLLVGSEFASGEEFRV